MRPIDQAGLELIKSFESFRSYPYKDSGGVWTIGYGYTHGVSMYSTPVTESQAEDMLRADLADAETVVCALVGVILSDNQYSALVSLVYNVGPAPLQRTLGNLLNEGDYTGAAEQFPLWNHVDGVVSLGLTRRRMIEKALFCCGGHVAPSLSS